MENNRKMRYSNLNRFLILIEACKSARNLDENKVLTILHIINARTTMENVKNRSKMYISNLRNIIYNIVFAFNNCNFLMLFVEFCAITCFLSVINFPFSIVGFSSFVL